MLIVIGSLLLLFSACAMLYQADKRRSAFASVRNASALRLLLRGGACALFGLTLALLSTLQGMERGITLWLGAFTFVFIGGLFLAAQKPDWHGPAGVASLAIGAVISVGGLVI